MNNKITIFLALLLIAIGCKKEKARICKIYEEPHAYTIGTITKLVSVPTRVTYKYEYAVNGISYTGKEQAYGVGQKNERVIGMDFLVVYKLNDHGESDLNTDYLIESQAEFQQLQSEFADNPPDPDWPNCK